MAEAQASGADLAERRSRADCREAAEVIRSRLQWFAGQHSGYLTPEELEALGSTGAMLRGLVRRLSRA